MHALPLVVSFVSALVLAPVVLRSLRSAGHTKANFRGRSLPFPFGVLVLVAALVALVPLAIVQGPSSTGVFHPETLPVAVYALGVIALGLIDDTLGERRSGGSRAARPAWLARSRRGGPARGAVDRRGQGGRLARPGAAGDELV